jgi:hypothetical protein
MNAKKTPLQVVNDEHGGKNKLVDKVVGLVEAGDEDKDSLRTRLLKSSNKKLLRLAAVSQTIRDKYGSTEKLVDAVAQKLNRSKDSDFVRRLASFTPAKLLDLVRSLSGEKRRPLKVAAVPARPAEKAPAKKKAAPKGKAGKTGKTAKAAPARKAPAKKPGARKPAKS